MSKPEARLKELKLTLPTLRNRWPSTRRPCLVGNMLYVSGHGPAKLSDKTPMQGKVGSELNTEQGKESARAVGLNILSNSAPTRLARSIR